MLPEQRPRIEPTTASGETLGRWTPPIGFELPTDREVGVSEEDVIGIGYQPDWSPNFNDRYVAVDERVEITFGVVVAPWPSVDRFGRPRFSADDYIAWFEATTLQEVLDNRRGRRSQLPRPLRIGDVFWVRGFNVEDPRQWGDALDVTAWARDAAKVAVYSVATGPVDFEVASELGLVATEEADNWREPPTPGPTATSGL
jgi:hypothetical protein